MVARYGEHGKYIALIRGRDLMTTVLVAVVRGRDLITTFVKEIAVIRGSDLI